LQAVKKGWSAFFDSLQKCRYFCAAAQPKSPRFARLNPCFARLSGHSIQGSTAQWHKSDLRDNFSSGKGAAAQES
jgi:hypothetical protein